ncbi:MAG: P-loop NTPase [Gemmatimonadota bacterium]|jgi:CO dehydrogenase nickel-insertion accessory protein CooC1
MNTTRGERPLSGQRIGLFGKGGSGKSTVTVMLARALRDQGYPVVVLDADSTNVGLAAALGADREPDPLLEHFGGMVFSGGSVTCPVDDPTPLTAADLSVEALPSRFVGHCGRNIHLLTAGKLGELGPGAGCDGPVAKIARDLRLRVQGSRPLTLVDFKAGFEDAARGVITSVDRLVAVVDPTTAAVAIAGHMLGMVRAIRGGTPPATEHLERPDLVETQRRLFRDTRVRDVQCVLNRVPTPQVEARLREVLSGMGIPVLGVLGDDPDVAEQWLLGVPLHSPRLEDAGARIAARLEASGGVRPRRRDPASAAPTA